MRATEALALLRDLVLMGLGAGWVIREVFFAAMPSMAHIALALAMMCGSATLSAVWLAGRSPAGGPSSTSVSPSAPSPPPAPWSGW